MLITGAEVEGRSPLDVRVAGERIAAVGASLRPEPGEEVVEAGGGALLPGLHDHHIHLFALAAAESSVRCGPPQVRDREALVRALRSARPAGGWLRGVGYHESVAGELDRRSLDALVPEHPLRIQHRSGALWMLNSAGLARIGLSAAAGVAGVECDAAGRPNGRLHRLDAWLRERLGPGPPPDLAGVGERLAAYGVSGVTDATPGNGEGERAAIGAALASGALRQRVLLMGGDRLAGECHPLVSVGARKVMLSESALPAFEALASTVKRAHAAGRAVAVHCVTRAELVFAVEAFREAGARSGDRIEHAAVTPPALLEQIRELPLTVVTQPNFVSERGDAYLCDVDPLDRAWLYRARAFLDAGVPLAAGTDAPFGHPDPWRAMRAAALRRTGSGARLGPDEALAPQAALALFTGDPAAPGGPPRRVAAGAPADLCLLEAPWAEARRALDSGAVRATWLAGALTWWRDRASG